MRTSMLHAVVAVLAGVACSDSTTAPVTSWTATLNVANELGVPGATDTATATLAGTATVTIAGGGSAAGTITYNLHLTGATSSGNTISAAHIHTGNAGAGGPVRVNLCGTGAPAPACPTGGGTGDITGAQVQYASGSSSVLGAPALTFDGLVAAIRANGTYVNVHTSKNPGGEIRGQLIPPTP